MSSDPELAATFLAPRRLHVAAAVAGALAALRGLALPLVAALFLGGGSGGLGSALAYGVLGAAASLAIGVVSWRTTSYRLSANALHLRSGAFSPDDTVVPVARIQALDTVQSPLQRLFGVVELHVQTPGGGARGELVLRAIAPRDARALRAALGHPEPERRGPVRRLGLGALVVAALTAPQFGVVLPIVGAIFAGADDLFGNVVDQDVLRRLESPREVVLDLALVVGAALLLSFLGALVAFAGFEVERDGDRLRIRRGLLQRRTATLPVARVDGVAVVEGLLRAPFGLATVRLETAGYRREQAAARTLFPLVRTRDVPALLADLVPGLDASPPVLGRPPRRSLRRYLVPPGLAAGGLGLAAVLAVGLADGGGAAPAGGHGWLWGLAAALGLCGALVGLLDFRAAGLHLAPDRVVLRTRRGTARTTLVARRLRLQETSVRRNVLQRRAGLATFGLALGSGRRGAVRHLEAVDADAALDALR